MGRKRKPAQVSGAAGKNTNRSGRSTEASAAKPRPGRAAPRSSAGQDITPEKRWQMIAVAAYLRAEKRGFIGGDSAEDWLAAQAEVDALLARTEA